MLVNAVLLNNFEFDCFFELLQYQIHLKNNNKTNGTIRIESDPAYLVTAGCIRYPRFPIFEIQVSIHFLRSPFYSGFMTTRIFTVSLKRCFNLSAFPDPQRLGLQPMVSDWPQEATPA